MDIKYRPLMERLERFLDVQKEGYISAMRQRMQKMTISELHREAMYIFGDEDQDLELSAVLLKQAAISCEQLVQQGLQARRVEVGNIAIGVEVELDFFSTSDFIRRGKRVVEIDGTRPRRQLLLGTTMPFLFEVLEDKVADERDRDLRIPVSSQILLGNLKADRQASMIGEYIAWGKGLTYKLPEEPKRNVPFSTFVHQRTVDEVRPTKSLVVGRMHAAGTQILR